jgi:hypothetical protein
MNVAPGWREKALKTSVVLVLINPAYYFVAISVGSEWKASEAIWIHFLQVGWLMAFVSLVCAAIGRGPHRWKSVVAAAIENLFWWFMGIGA